MQKSWRDLIPVHPAAELFPLMGADELRTLADDIKANGLLHKVILAHTENPDGTINCDKYCVLDGRNRLDAMEAAAWPLGPLFTKRGIPNPEIAISFVDGFDGDHETVLAANVYRRHLTGEQRRDVIAKLLKARPEQSDRQVASKVAVDHKTVGSVRADMEQRGEIPHVETRTDTKGRKQPVASAALLRDDVRDPVVKSSDDDTAHQLAALNRAWRAAGKMARLKFLHTTVAACRMPKDGAA